MYGKRIYEQRKKKGLTQKDVADALGITNISVSQWENEKKMPCMKNLTELSKLFNAPIEYLIGNDKYVIANEDESYGLMMTKEEINLIKKLRSYKKLYNMLTTDTERVLERINRNYQ